MPRTEIDLITEMHTDIQWMKEYVKLSEKKYAKKYVEYFVQAGMLSFILWGLNQVLELIPNTIAFISYHITL